ncbi:MAG: IclR family transcriptional regulator [Bacilli bacterium]
MRTDVGQVAVIQKMAEILDLIAGTDEVNVLRISQQLGIPRTTVHRILQTLATCDVLTPEYRPGPRLISWAHRAFQTMDLREAGTPVLEHLVQLFRETASIFVRVGASRICIERLEGMGLLPHRIKIGEPVPLHAGSAGRILLAWLDPSEQTRLWQESVNLFGPIGTGRSPNWQDIRRDGWTISLGERDQILSSISAPIFGASGEVVGALSLSGPKERLSEARMRTIAPELRVGADSIQQRMNGLPMPNIT